MHGIPIAPDPPPTPHQRTSLHISQEARLCSFAGMQADAVPVEGVEPLRHRTVMVRACAHLPLTCQ
jgi:hypothetical protein